MKILKKLALANPQSGAIFHDDLPHSAQTKTFLSVVCDLQKLAHWLYKYLFVTKTTSSKNLSFHYHTRTSIAFESSQGINWAPLIKTTLRTKNRNISNQINKCNYHLAGCSILCVGGRSKLYPEYNQLIENLGANLITFHGDSNNHLGKLSCLLEKADLIICPIDCVNHQAFFMVKYYCKYSGKPCVLLDRSEIDTFSQGIDLLNTLTTEKLFN
jgi:hypothetical protein